ncbi:MULTISPECIES: hypothetical protein [Spirosoma]|uniref:DUF4595 domain-containing protein n=1 Tax=Spirosoma sordidisoli TaxID=2502893 RepID=A0A4Q2UPZ1_9BACT|nr:MULTISPECIES: hypothetical protein [Spirosoma]RYC69690.1 hypothetical protein EQG79_13910 [Spirosoma sordidisoli]
MNTTMISRPIKRYLGFLLLLGWLGCTDHRDSGVSPGSAAVRLRVKTLTLDLPDGLAKVSAFSYDPQGRLSAIKTYQSPDSTVSDVEYSRYQYDSQNRLVQLRHEVVRRTDTGKPNPVEQYTYTYNGLGQAEQLAYLNGFTLTLNYNAVGQLISSQREYTFRSFRLTGADSFTYTGNNVTEVNSSRFFTTTTRSTRSYRYDDKINPFYGVFIIPAPYPEGFADPVIKPTINTYFGGLDNLLNLNQNNVVSETSTFSGTLNYEYQYNANNLPILRRVVNPNNGQVLETLRFDYETY